MEKYFEWSWRMSPMRLVQLRRQSCASNVCQALTACCNPRRTRQEGRPQDGHARPCSCALPFVLFAKTLRLTCTESQDLVSSSDMRVATAAALMPVVDIRANIRPKACCEWRSCISDF
jgi:hypothetical protein